MKHQAGFYEKYIKRLLDILLSGLGILVLAPVYLLLAIAGMFMLVNNLMQIFGTK